MAFLLLDQALGEYETETKIGATEFAAAPGSLPGTV